MQAPDKLADAIREVQLLDTPADDWIDGVLNQARPRKRVKPTTDELKEQLEKEFLAPSPTFSTEWLNKLQQYA